MKTVRRHRSACLYASSLFGQECLRNVLNKYSLRMHHTTHYVETMLRELTVNHLQNEQLFKMYPVQSTLTHYGLALGGLTELLAVRAAHGLSLVACELARSCTLQVPFSRTCVWERSLCH